MRTRRAAGGQPIWGVGLVRLIVMAILNFFFLLLPVLGHACRVYLDCGLGRYVQGGDGRYECSCAAGHGGKRCEAVLRLKRSADETSPCSCSNGDDCTNFSGDGSEPKTTTVSPCIPTQKLPSKIHLTMSQRALSSTLSRTY